MIEMTVVCGGLEYQARYFPKLQNAVILDIGANIGTFAVYSANVLAKFEPSIYSIEPSTENYQYLMKNIEINQLTSQIKTFKLAIGRDSEEAVLEETSNKDAFKLTYDTSFTGKGERVLVSSLATFFSTQDIHHVDLMKIDIEGGEFDLFNLELDFIKRNVSRVFVEVHNLDAKRNLESFTKVLVANKVQYQRFLGSNVLFILL